MSTSPSVYLANLLNDSATGETSFGQKNLNSLSASLNNGESSIFQDNESTFDDDGESDIETILSCGMRSTTSTPAPCPMTTPDITDNRIIMDNPQAMFTPCRSLLLPTNQDNQAFTAPSLGLPTTVPSTPVVAPFIASPAQSLNNNISGLKRTRPVRAAAMAAVAASASKALFSKNDEGVNRKLGKTGLANQACSKKRKEEGGATSEWKDDDDNEYDEEEEEESEEEDMEMASEAETPDSAIEAPATIIASTSKDTAMASSRRDRHAAQRTSRRPLGDESESDSDVDLDVDGEDLAQTLLRLRALLRVRQGELNAISQQCKGLTAVERKKVRNRKASCVSRLKKKIMQFEQQGSLEVCQRRISALETELQVRPCLNLSVALCCLWLGASCAFVMGRDDVAHFLFSWSDGTPSQFLIFPF